MVDLEKEIKFIKGVGPNRATLLNKLGIYNLKDLITYFPREHEDRGKAKNISELEDGEEALICAYPVGRMNEVRRRGNLTLCKLIVRDETGSCQLTPRPQPLGRKATGKFFLPTVFICVCICVCVTVSVS